MSTAKITKKKIKKFYFKYYSAHNFNKPREVGACK